MEGMRCSVAWWPAQAIESDLLLSPVMGEPFLIDITRSTSGVYRCIPKDVLISAAGFSGLTTIVFIWPFFSRRLNKLLPGTPPTTSPPIKRLRSPGDGPTLPRPERPTVIWV